MDDPFSVLNHECEYSSSQEERFRHIRFCGERALVPVVPSRVESSTQGEGIPVDSTEIMICSLPETPNSQSDKFLTPNSQSDEFLKPNSQSDEFLTPRENLLVSSQEKAMILALRGSNDRHGKLKTSDISTDQFEPVDLDENNDLRFSSEKSPSKKGKEVLGFSRESSLGRKRTRGDILGEVGSRACVVRTGNVAGEYGLSALGENLALLKNLRLLQQNMQNLLTANLQPGGVGGEKNSTTEAENVGGKSGLSASGENLVLKNLGLSQQYLLTASLQSGGVGGGTPVDKESAGTECKNNSTKVVSPSKTTEAGNVAGESGLSASVENLVPSKNLGLLPQNLLTASLQSGGVGGGTPVDKESAGTEYKNNVHPGTPSSENQSFKSLMDAMVILSGENNSTTESENVDILQTVEQRGMKFPRPRWWQQGRF